MYFSGLGFNSYDDYKKSPLFQRCRKIVGVGIKKCKRCKTRLVRFPHHLTYINLGDERPRDIVGVCFDCNDLAHFYDNGDPVPVTPDGYYLRKRWKEINSWWWYFKQKRPSDFFDWLQRAYRV